MPEVQGANGELDRFLADWVLGRVTPEEVVERAVRALGAGCHDQAIAVVAGSNATTRGEIEAELPRLLAAFGRVLPTADQALKLLVDGCASRIAEGRTDPVRGARALFDLWVNEHESRELMVQIRPLVDLALDDDVALEGSVRGGAIRREAVAFVSRGGLRLPL